MEYFSDRDKGNKEQNIETISTLVWGGIVALIRKHWAKVTSQVMQQCN